MHALRLGESLRIETTSLEGEERKGLLEEEPFYSPFGPNFPLVIHIFQIFLRNVRIGVRSTRVELLQLARNCDHSTLVVDNAICVVSANPHLAPNILSRELRFAFHPMTNPWARGWLVTLSSYPKYARENQYGGFVHSRHHPSPRVFPLLRRYLRACTREIRSRGRES